MSLYRRSGGRRYEEADEPLTIDADVIAAYLNRCNKPSMASFVLHLGRRLQDANKREMELFNRVVALQAKYEPSQPRVEPNYMPPPEASD